VEQKYSFTGKIDLFEGYMGWYYVPVPIELCDPLRDRSEWGLIAVTATVGNTSWPTSLLPKGDGTHFVALPAKVRKKENLSVDMTIEVSFEPRIREKKK